MIFTVMLWLTWLYPFCYWCRRTDRLRLKCDGTRAETRFLLSAKRTSPFKSAGTSVQSTTGSRGVRISGSNAGYTMFRGSVKGTGYPLHSPVSPSLPLPCVTACHHISTGLCTWDLFYTASRFTWIGAISSQVAFFLVVVVKILQPCSQCTYVSPTTKYYSVLHRSRECSRKGKERISETEHCLCLVTFIAYPQTIVKKKLDRISLAAY